MIVEPIPNSDKVILVDDRLLDWIAVRIPHVGADHGWHGRAHAIGVGMNGEIVAAMAVMNSNGHNAEISMATDSPIWATRTTIRKLLEYPFVQLGLRRITTLTIASNETALKMNRQLGFKHEGIMRHGYGDEDIIIMGLLREEADRWLKSPVRSDTKAAHSMEANA